MRRLPTFLRIDPLESRDAPATLVNASQVEYQDVDGDIVTVKFSKPVLTTANVDSVFQFDTGLVDGDNTVRQQLQTLDMTSLGNGKWVSVKATQANGGDGWVDVGWVKADGVDVREVYVHGDLGRITAGDARTGTPGVGTLYCWTLGTQGTATQAPGGDLHSVINGPLTYLLVDQGDVKGAWIDVIGGANGRIGGLYVQGSLIADPVEPSTGLISATGAIGNVSIIGDVIGGDGADSGIRAGGHLRTVLIDGNVFGGAGQSSAEIRAGGRINLVSIKGNILGGDGDYSASIHATNILKAFLEGTLTGGVGKESAAVVVTGGHIGTFFMEKQNTGGAGEGSGGVAALSVTTPSGAKRGGNISEAYMGPMVGGDGDYSGSVWADGRIGKVLVGFDTVIDGGITGGVGRYSAAIVGDRIGSVFVSDEVVGGDGEYSAAIVAGRSIGIVDLFDNLIGGAGDWSASISASDIGTVHIESGLINGVASVTGGTGKQSASIVAWRTIGRVILPNGDWTGASIVAGFDPGADGYFGTDDDLALTDAKGRPIQGRIGTIIINGFVEGTAGPDDSFAFQAARVGTAIIAGSTKLLKAGAWNDTTPIALGTFGDFVLVEK